MPKLTDHYAVLVAINHYPGIGPLHGPENDAAEFHDWLRDVGGGNVDDDNIRLIRSSDFPQADNPDDANPTESAFKKVLNAWVRKPQPGGEWRARVGARLYLFFAGHGFTAMALSDPALFTAQARLGDPVHIAALRYAAKIENAGFFDEIVLLMDCCQDVLKASQVNEPTWNPPDRGASSRVKVMKAYGAPRGSQAFETETSPVRGYFSTVLMDSLRNAPADMEGYVTARAVEDRFTDTWTTTYKKVTGYTPPITGPRDLRLYRRSRPTQVAPLDPLTVGPSGPQAAMPGGRSGGGAAGAPRIAGTVGTPELGAQIFVLDEDGRRVAEGTGHIDLDLRPGRYTARFALADVVQDVAFDVRPESGRFVVELKNLLFASPVPLDDTATHHEYHHYPALDLAAAAVAHNLNAPFGPFATLIVFARDSAHREDDAWKMAPEARDGLRLRVLNDSGGEPEPVEIQVEVNERRGYACFALHGLRPGSYLLGVRRRLQDRWYWQEIALTLAADRWRTEVYLDSVHDDTTGRRFDVESAGVLVVPGTSGMWLDDPSSRHTELARLALAGGHTVTRGAAIESALDWNSPMLALYTAYALSLSATPDAYRVSAICRHLAEIWTGASGDIKLLEKWCAAIDPALAPVSIELAPDEVPMIARGWELSKIAPTVAQISLDVQCHVGAWRVAGSLWTQTLIPDEAQDLGNDRAMALTGAELGTPDLARIAKALVPVNPLHSPLQQSLRRMIIDAAESDDAEDLDTCLARVSTNTGLDMRVVRSALDALVEKRLEPVSASSTLAAG